MKRLQSGSATVETAFTLSIVVAAGMLFSDLFLLMRARVDLERSTHMLAATLANQAALTNNGVQQLLSGLAAQRGDTYQYYVAKVLPDRTLSWELPLGDATGLCDSPVEGGSYQGVLPEAEDSQASDGRTALLVVRACQAAGEVGLTQLQLDKNVLQIDAVERMRTASVTLDETLAALAGVK
ncbi:hypothetical protein [Pseudomonas caricapapayae]|uniref:hypothetical protein n=1 Tax=Pseudomonas caricapapayae TaxID=46678 RepID=UPI000EFF52DD|nr:hypothetical protein [Pseudomonas caricapapayae]